MNATKNICINLFNILAVCLLSQTSGLSQTNFSVTPNLAFQVSFPSQESYQYQAQFSTNLSNWLPASAIQVSTGGVQTLTFGMTNGPQALYRVQAFPPNLTNRIVGLTNIFLDNAVFQGQGASMTVSGFRVQSRDYNLSDYLIGEFQFDLLKQTFALTNLQVFTNIGVVCGQMPPYYIINATNNLALTNELTTLTPDSYHTITSTGQVMTVSLQVGQVLSFNYKVQSITNEVIVIDPNGNKIDDEIAVPGYTWWFGGYGGLVSGVYSFQLVPMGALSESITFEFHNDNGHQLITFTNGIDVAAASYGPNSGDYLKYEVALTGGQTLQITGPNSGADLSIFNSLGVQVFTVASSASTPAPVFYTATSTDTYYVILWHTDLIAHSYSTAVSITP